MQEYKRKLIEIVLTESGGEPAMEITAAPEEFAEIIRWTVEAGGEYHFRLTDKVLAYLVNSQGREISKSTPFQLAAIYRGIETPVVWGKYGDIDNWEDKIQWEARRIGKVYCFYPADNFSFKLKVEREIDMGKSHLAITCCLEVPFIV